MFIVYGFKYVAKPRFNLEPQADEFTKTYKKSFTINNIQNIVERVKKSTF
jgi:hypothetical protein